MEAGSGGRRLHQKPNRYEIEACRPWLEGELHLLRPRLIVGLGATTCQAMLGSRIRVLTDRGKIFGLGGPQGSSDGPPLVDFESKGRGFSHENREAFVADLRQAARLVSA
ncbi:MAG: uracil-DNA glycosylase family protein [Acidimicrobiia bacterium]